jgi:ribosome-binding factor A
MSSHKHDRIQSEILNLLNHTLKFEIYDEFIKKASFTYVKLSDDNLTAHIYVDTFDRNLIDKLVTKLQESKGVFRKQLANNMAIRKIPDLKFYVDRTIDNSYKIDELLDKINR